jgi:hypothetical protein
VFVTLILVAVQLVVPSTPEQMAVVGFMVGFFPQIGLQALQAGLSKPLGRLIPTLQVEHPLSELDGLNIWYEARLAEEGVEDMQNLISANLVDLMLHSRAPVARLVDWIDQACLCLHLPSARALGLSDSKSVDLPRNKLRRIGIRTASDLKRSWDALGHDDAFRRQIGIALGMPPDEGAVAVQAILHGFEGEPNYWHVLEFKRHGWLHSDSRRSGRRRNGRTDRDTGTTTSVAADLILPEPAMPPAAVTVN